MGAFRAFLFTLIVLMVAFIAFFHVPHEAPLQESTSAGDTTGNMGAGRNATNVTTPATTSSPSNAISTNATTAPG